MRALTWQGDEKVTVENAPDPTLPAGEVRRATPPG